LLLAAKTSWFIYFSRRRNVIFSILQVLNLFLALLLSSFGASNLSAGGGGDDDNSKLSEAFNRIGRFRRWVKNIVGRTFINVKDRILECCQRQISARRGRVKNFKSLSHFRPPSSIFLSFCLNYIFFYFFSNFSQFFFFFFFSLFLFFFRSDSNTPAVQIEATEESEQGADGMIYFSFILLDLIQLLSI